MTNSNGVALKAESPNLEHFRRACEYALAHDAVSLLYTGKGEPMVWPDKLTEYLSVSQDFPFPSVEMQTAGVQIADRKPVTDAHLIEWRKLGLKLIAISISHYDKAANKNIYMRGRKRDYIELPKLITDLHGFGYEVRLACVMVRSDASNPNDVIRGIDTPEELARLIEFARENKVDQLTVRPVNKPDDHAKAEPDFDQDVANFIATHYLTDEHKAALKGYLDEHGTLVDTLPWGGYVYDVNGQNVCFTNSLTKDEGLPVGRQLIFFPNGTVSDDWTKPAQPLDEYIKQFGG
jgi:molybdenum cofactor biosynthesis enzyme MoaA